MRRGAIARGCRRDGSGVDCLGPLHKGIHKGRGDVGEDRADHLFKNRTGEVVFESEVNPAGIFGKRGECPVPLEGFERPREQLHVDALARHVDIARGKRLADAPEVDVEFRRYGIAALL